jgi:hypothetical protein
MLTGQCKKDFETWLFHSNYGFMVNVRDSVEGNYEHEVEFCNEFKGFPFSMQWGVYQDFFISKEMKVDVYSAKHKGVVYYEYDLDDFGGDKDTMLEAREASIKKANQVYNNKNS